MSSESVLLVERDVLVRHPLAEYLRQCGFKVAEAVDAEEARQLFVKNLAGWNFVLLNVALENDRGLALASWISSLHSATQVTMSRTLNETAQSVGNLCQGGPQLAKPYDDKLVFAHIRRLQAARERAKGE